MDENKIVGGFLIAWVIGALVSLGIAAVVIWAIVRMVAKYG